MTLVGNNESPLLPKHSTNSKKIYGTPGSPERAFGYLLDDSEKRKGMEIKPFVVESNRDHSPTDDRYSNIEAINGDPIKSPKRRQNLYGTTKGGDTQESDFINLYDTNNRQKMPTQK